MENSAKRVKSKFKKKNFHKQTQHKTANQTANNHKTKNTQQPLKNGGSPKPIKKILKNDAETSVCTEHRIGRLDFTALVIFKYLKIVQACLFQDEKYHLNYFKMQSFSVISEDSNMRLGHCADLVNQIATFAHDIKPYKKPSKLREDCKPVALSSERFMWVKRRPVNEKHRKGLEEETKKLQEFWMRETEFNITKPQNRKNGVFEKVSHENKINENKTAESTTAASTYLPSATTTAETSTDPQVQDSLQNKSNEYQMSSLGNHLTVCGDFVDLDPRKDEKDKAIGRNFMEKLELAFQPKNKRFTQEYKSHLEHFLANINKLSSDEEIVVRAGYSGIVKILKKIGRTDLIEDMVQVLTPDAAFFCDLMPNWLNYKRARSLYVLLEQFYTFDSDSGKSPQSRKSVPSEKVCISPELIPKFKNSMKSFDEFISKVICLLEEVQTFSEKSTNSSYVKLILKVRTKILSMLKGKPLLHKMVTTHLFDEFSADMFEPETCFWLDDPNQRKSLYKNKLNSGNSETNFGSNSKSNFGSSFPFTNSFENSPNTEDTPDTSDQTLPGNFLKHNLVFKPSEQALHTMTLNKRLPGGFSEYAKHSQPRLPLSNEPLVPNASRIIEMLLLQARLSVDKIDAANKKKNAKKDTKKDVSKKEVSKKETVKIVKRKLQELKNDDKIKAGEKVRKMEVGKKNDVFTIVGNQSVEKSDPDEKFNASTESNLTEEKSADTVTSKSDQMDISLEESQSAEDHSIEKVGNSSKIQPILLLDENACDGVDHEANNITLSQSQISHNLQHQDQLSQSSTISTASKIEGLLTSEQCLRQISEEQDVQNSWTPFERRILFSKWDLVEIPEEVDDDKCEDIAIEFCKKLEAELNRDWEDIKEQLDQHCSEQVGSDNCSDSQSSQDMLK